MCLICVEFQKERMTIFEARRAFGEMVEGLDDKHATEVEQMISKAEQAKRREADEADDG